MKKILGFSLIVLTVAACSKDKFKTVPQVTITSFGPPEVTFGNLITLNANVTDKESDQDSVLVVRKRYTGTLLLTTDTVRSKISNLGAPEKQEYNLQIQFIYGVVRPEIAPIQNSESIDRNYTLGIIVKDKAGNRSDYVESDKIILKKV